MLDDQIQHGPEGVRKDTLIDKLTGYPEEGRMISESRQSLDGIIQEGARQAERYWRKLNGSEMSTNVIADAIFIDGVIEKAA